MSLPSDVPELAMPTNFEADAAEVSRCLDEAARMVQTFAGAGAPAALIALLASAEEAPGSAAEQALKLAETVTKQGATLHAEVARFLSTSRAV